MNQGGVIAVCLCVAAAAVPSCLKQGGRRAAAATTASVSRAVVRPSVAIHTGYAFSRAETSQLYELAATQFSQQAPEELLKQSLDSGTHYPTPFGPPRLPGRPLSGEPGPRLRNPGTPLYVEDRFSFNKSDFQASPGDSVAEKGLNPAVDARQLKTRPLGQYRPSKLYAKAKIVREAGARNTLRRNTGKPKKNPAAPAVRSSAARLPCAAGTSDERKACRSAGRAQPRGTQ